MVVPRKGFSLLKGRLHSFPFKLEFPTRTSCLKKRAHDGRLRFQLPPAFSIDSKSLNAKIVYLLRVKVKRSFAMPRQLLSQRELDFAPLFSPSVHNFSSRIPDNSPSVGVSKLLKLGGGDLEFRAELVSQYLCTGGALGITFAICHDDASDRRLNLVCLQSLDIDLQMTVTITHPTRTSRTLSVLSVAKSNLKREISMPTGMAIYRIEDASLSQLTVPPTPPGFIACAVRVQHAVCIQAKFSSGTSDQVCSGKLITSHRDKLNHLGCAMCYPSCHQQLQNSRTLVQHRQLTISSYAFSSSINHHGRIPES